MKKSSMLNTIAANMVAAVAVAASVVEASDIDAIDAVLADIGAPVTENNVAIETQNSGPSDLEIEAAVIGAETQEIVEKSYNDAPGGDMVADPAADQSKKKGKGKGKGKKKADATGDATAPVEAAPKKQRIHFASKTARLQHNLAGNLGSLCVLETSSVALTAQDVAQQEQATLEVIKGLAIKPQNRATLLMEFIGGKSSKLNEVIKRTFETLHKDGFITRGDKGNLHANLLSKPYDPKTARATGNNTIVMLKALKVLSDTTPVKGEPTKLVANLNSAILAKVNAQLGL